MKQTLSLIIALCTPCFTVAALEISIGPSDKIGTAVQKVREERKAGDASAATIWLKGGRYEFDRSIGLKDTDNEISFKAVAGEKPLLIGGTVVSGFTPHEGEIVKADVSKMGPKDKVLRQLLVDGEHMILARYPNHDAVNPLYGGWAFAAPFPGGEAPEGHDWKRHLFVKKEDIRQWAHPEDVEIDIFPEYGWWNFVGPIESLNAKTGKLVLKTPSSRPLHPFNRFHFQNALEELDSLGEWFLDPRTQMLYLWPTKSLESAEVRLITLDSFFVVTGAKAVRFEGLSFRGCNSMAIQLKNTDACEIAHCTIDHVGYFKGVGISSSGKNNLIRDNEISATGYHGIALSGGDRITLEPSNQVVTNNHIHHMGVFNKDAAGVHIMGVGVTVSHNHIHDGPRMAVQMIDANLINVEYNHLHHLCLETQDGGAIYTRGRDWLGGRGNRWCYNHIHDVIGCGQSSEGLKFPHFTFGLYPDDNTGGVDIIGNLVYRVAHASVHLHNTRDCLVENNIFAGGSAYQFDMQGWETDHRFYIEFQDDMTAGFESVKDQPAWQKMRGMNRHPLSTIQPDGTMMNNNVVRRNIMFANGSGAKHGDLRHVPHDSNVIDENLTWNNGEPIVTEINHAGKAIGEPLRTENFDAIENGKTPAGWGFVKRPNDSVKLQVKDGSLVTDCARSDNPKHAFTALRGPVFPIVSGHAYRWRLRVKSTEPTSPIAVGIAIFKDGNYWQCKPKDVIATPEWQEIEISATMPDESSSKWKPWMTEAWLKMDCNADKGRILIDDMRLTGAKPMSEWEAWQSEGWDQHSLAADPLFEDVSKDDNRLKPESPAIQKLGFKPLPIEQMGILKPDTKSPKDHP